MESTKQRLDQLLVERGLYESRSRAAAAVMAGRVRVGSNGGLEAKPGQQVNPQVEIVVAAQAPYVSRGGQKLENALKALELDVRGRHCLDVGSSTGGFTDCLLQHGATRVAAVDVAYGAIHWSLRRDPRVTVIERFNARSLRPQDLPFSPEFVVMDLSFISLTKVLPTVLVTAAAGFHCLALIKPQFEVGREGIGKGGVVTDPTVRHRALVSVGQAVLDLGFAVRGYCSSGLPGPAGNRESFILVDDEVAGVTDISRAALVAEPEGEIGSR